MSDDEILAAFCDPVGVPAGWTLHGDRPGNPWWSTVHGPTGWHLEVYPPATPRADNLVHWVVLGCARDAGGKVFAWGVTARRDEAFVNAVPVPSTAPQREYRYDERARFVQPRSRRESSP